MNDACAEVWKQSRYPLYEVSNIGRIRNKISGQIKKCYQNGNGYMIVNVYKSKRRVHVLVAETFIGPKPPGLDVNHKDGKKTNNRDENLEYLTRSENCKHAFRLGLSYTPFRERGEDHHSCKVKDCDALSILKEYKQGVTRRALAIKYNISYYTVWDITDKRRRWSYLIDS